MTLKNFMRLLASLVKLMTNHIFAQQSIGTIMHYLENPEGYLVEVKRKNYLKTKIGIHTKVCNELMRSNDPTENYVGNLLLKLKAARGYADYDWNEKKHRLL